MLNFGILCLHVISFFATVLLPSLTKIGGNPIKKDLRFVFVFFSSGASLFATLLPAALWQNLR